MAAREDGESVSLNPAAISPADASVSSGFSAHSEPCPVSSATDAFQQWPAGFGSTQPEWISGDNRWGGATGRCPSSTLARPTRGCTPVTTMRSRRSTGASRRAPRMRSVERYGSLSRLRSHAVVVRCVCCIRTQTATWHTGPTRKKGGACVSAPEMN